MKTMLWAAALMTAVMVPMVQAEDLVNKKEFQVAADKAGDLRFSMSLAQTAQLLDFCGSKAKAQEVRDYLQPATMMITVQAFEGVEGSDVSKQNMRGMFLSRAITAALATEMSTQALLKQMAPVSEEQKKKLCDIADKDYAKVSALQARAKASQGAPAAKPE